MQKQVMSLPTEVDAKSPERQDFCAKTSDNTPPGRLPGQCAYLEAGTAPKADCIKAHRPCKVPRNNLWGHLFQGHLPKEGLGLC